jgi:hypothetical protein
VSSGGARCVTALVSATRGSVIEAGRMPHVSCSCAVFMIACAAPPAPKSEASAQSLRTAPIAKLAPVPGSSRASSARVRDQAALTVPSTCSASGRSCVPDPAFTKRMCNESFPALALYFFGNRFPFTHGYLTRKTQAWNASGGASDNGYLEFDEEVLLLAERGSDPNAMQVSGEGGGFEALRWNGSCVTLAKEELTLRKPPSPKAAKVEWRFLDDNVQAALRQDSVINSAVITRRRECKGATSGEVSFACVKADDRLSQTLVDYLRKGGTSPVPSRLPR